MSHTIRVFTHESIIHSQMQSIEKVLNHEVIFSITLNSKGLRSCLDFEATEDEMRRLNNDLGYKVYHRRANEWLLYEGIE